MADFAPPSGPPPPKVPEGWKAVWDDKYKEWFYVNIHTKKSQWDKPTKPVYPPKDDEEEPDVPPAYDPKSARAVGPEKSNLGSNNPFSHSGTGGSGAQDTSSDEELARKLQAEEDAHGPGGSRGEADNYYNDGHSGQTSSQGGYANPKNDDNLPPRPEQQKRGLFGKLLGKNKTSSSQQQQPPQQQQQYYPPQQQPYYPYGPQPGAGYGYPPPGGYYPPGGPGGYYGGGYDRPQRQGLGTAGAVALGAGGGLLGGMLLGEALDGGDGGWGGDGDYGGGGDFGGGA